MTANDSYHAWLCRQRVTDYQPKVFGSCELTKTALLPAAKVRDEATKILRNAVMHFSESATLSLAPIIDEEPKLDAPEPETLTV